MAMSIDSVQNPSSHHGEAARQPNTQASAYVVDAHTMALTGFHFATCGGGAAGEWHRRIVLWSDDGKADRVCEQGGGFEDGLGSPPTPPRGLIRGDAACHITGESERLFCETLETVFLVEKDAGFENSLVVDTRTLQDKPTHGGQASSLPVRLPHDTLMKHNLPTPSQSPDMRDDPRVSSLVKEYVEVWDYTGGARFRGFVAEKETDRTLFVFFDSHVLGQDLKPGYVRFVCHPVDQG